MSRKREERSAGADHAVVRGRYETIVPEAVIGPWVDVISTASRYRKAYQEEFLSSSEMDKAYPKMAKGWVEAQIHAAEAITHRAYVSVSVLIQSHRDYVGTMS